MLCLVDEPQPVKHLAREQYILIVGHEQTRRPVLLEVECPRSGLIRHGQRQIDAYQSGLSIGSLALGPRNDIIPPSIMCQVVVTHHILVERIVMFRQQAAARHDGRHGNHGLEPRPIPAPEQQRDHRYHDRSAPHLQEILNRDLGEIEICPAGDHRLEISLPRHGYPHGGNYRHGRCRTDEDLPTASFGRDRLHDHHHQPRYRRRTAQQQPYGRYRKGCHRAPQPALADCRHGNRQPHGSGQRHESRQGIILVAQQDPVYNRRHEAQCPEHIAPQSAHYPLHTLLQRQQQQRHKSSADQRPVIELRDEPRNVIRHAAHTHDRIDHIVAVPQEHLVTFDIEQVSGIAECEKRPCSDRQCRRQYPMQIFEYSFHSEKFSLYSNFSAGASK